jgi:26S proteasome regulatory subunit N11
VIQAFTQPDSKMDMSQLQRLLMQRGGGGNAAADTPMQDTAEKIQISSLSLLKMLKHGRAGVPMEVMGLMLGQFVDDYTITCVDVFAMPQHGTGVSVEAVDDVFQQEMLDMLKQTGRPEMVVGWYHSHPGFGCWLSGVDMNTQSTFEQLNARAVAVVVDPVQSVKGKVVIDAFRMIPGQGMMMMMPTSSEPRQTTSNIGFLKKPTIQARIHGLDRHYYSLVIDWRKNDLEEQMLMNLHKKDWTHGLKIQQYEDQQKYSEKMLEEMARLSKDYSARVKEEEGKTQEEVEVMNVGKIDPKRHLENNVQDLMASAILQCLGTMIDTVVF